MAGSAPELIGSMKNELLLPLHPDGPNQTRGDRIVLNGLTHQTGAAARWGTQAQGRADSAAITVFLKTVWVCEGVAGDCWTHVT